MYTESRDRIDREVRDRLTAVGDEKRHDLQKELGRILDAAERMAAVIASGAATDLARDLSSRSFAAIPEARIDGSQRNQRDAEHHETVTLLDPEGNAVATLGADLPPALASTASAAGKLGAAQFIEPHRIDDSIIEFGVSVPWPTKGSRPGGSVYMGESASRTLYSLLQDPRLSPGAGEILLAKHVTGSRADLVSLLRLDSSGAITLQPATARPRGAIDSGLRPCCRTYLERSLDRHDRLVMAYVAPIPSTPWLLVATLDHRAAYASLHQSAWIIGAAVIFLLTLAHWLCYGATRERPNACEAVKEMTDPTRAS